MLPVEVADYLAGAGLGLVAGTNIMYVPLTDDDPDLAVGITELPGKPDEGTFGASLSAPAFELPRILIHVRGTRNGGFAARTLAENIHKKLQRFGPVALAGTTYHDIRAAQPPYGPDYDANERPIYRMVYEITKERSVA